MTSPEAGSTTGVTVASGARPAASGHHAPATPEEVAAVVAALAVLTGGSAAAAGRTTPRWRFSGRWWTKPVPLVRSRP